MIYLLRSFGRDNRTDLKIGYTKDENLKKRQCTYYYHNPHHELLITIKGGTEEDEKKLHYKFRDLRSRDIHLLEWFVDCEEILEFFETCTLEDIQSLPNPPEKTRKTPPEERNQLWRDVKIEYWDDMSVEELEFADKFNSLSKFPRRILLICDVLMDNYDQIDDLLSHIPDPFKTYYKFLGDSVIRSVSGRRGELDKLLEQRGFGKEYCEDDLEDVIYAQFNIGDKKSRVEWKQLIGEIYTSLGIVRKPKANDLEEWFEIRECKITNSETGKRDKAFEIIKRK